MCGAAAGARLVTLKGPAIHSLEAPTTTATVADRASKIVLTGVLAPMTAMLMSSAGPDSMDSLQQAHLGDGYLALVQQPHHKQ